MGAATGAEGGAHGSAVGFEGAVGEGGAAATIGDVGAPPSVLRASAVCLEGAVGEAGTATVDVDAPSVLPGTRGGRWRW